MSDFLEDSEKKEVVIIKDDISNIENFFNHFGIPMPSVLKEKIEILKENPKNITWEDQEDLRIALSSALLTTNHDIMKNDVWKGILNTCDEVYFNARFDKDLETALTETK